MRFSAPRCEFDDAQGERLLPELFSLGPDAGGVPSRHPSGTVKAPHG